MARIKAVLFDMIGTTVREKDPLFINTCFRKAFEDHHIVVDAATIRMNRGKDKRQAIIDIMSMLGLVEDVESILIAFQYHVQQNLDNFSEYDDTREIIRFLKDKNISVGIGTGLSGDLFEMIFSYLKWPVYKFDYIGIAETIGRGRPHPDMIYDMIGKLKLKPSVFLKVGDTVADIQEGKNAGVQTAAILSGTQAEQVLLAEKPNYCIRSLSELKKIVI